MNLTSLARPALALVLAAAFAFPAAACPPEDATRPPAQAAPEVAKACPSTQELRAMGYKGLKVLLDEYDLASARTGGKAPAELAADLDAVAGQKDAAWSRLFWYTDLDAAKAAAEAEHKPILYLRMLGKLTDEFSCANSRFFRTALYANEGVSKVLRDQYVLVWQSERPVPVVTIDMGDGRVLKRTITGNSAHYILDADGRVVDVLPGLYDPATFVAALREAPSWIVRPAGSPVQGQYTATITDEYAHLYAERHEDRLLRRWKDESKVLADPKEEQVAAWVKADAVAAGRLAGSKCAVEQPMLAAISLDFAAEVRRSVSAADDAVWQRVADLHKEYARLDRNSIALIKAQNPGATDEAIARTVAAFEKTLLQDTVRNNYNLRVRALGWLKEAKSPVAVEDFNQRVYAELFLTPRSDPWLGLADDSTYSALSCDGRCEPQVVTTK